MMNSGKDFLGRPQSRDVLPGPNKASQLFKLTSQSNTASSEQKRTLSDKMGPIHQDQGPPGVEEVHRPVGASKEARVSKQTEFFAAHPRATGGQRTDLVKNKKFTGLFSGKPGSRSRLSSHEFNEDLGGEGAPKQVSAELAMNQQIMNPKKTIVPMPAFSVSSKRIVPNMPQGERTTGTSSVASFAAKMTSVITPRASAHEESPISPSRGLRTGIIEQTISIRIMSSWNSSSNSVGLHSLELRDRADNLIEVKPGYLSCRNCGIAAPKNLHNLIETGNADTPDWKCILPTHASTSPEILLDLRTAPAAGKLKIWYSPI